MDIMRSSCLLLAASRMLSIHRPQLSKTFQAVGRNGKSGAWNLTLAASYAQLNQSHRSSLTGSARYIRVIPLHLLGLSPTAIGRWPAGQVRQASNFRQAPPGTEGVKFEVRPEEARGIFEQWSKKNTPLARVPTINSIQSYYLPFWCFTADFRATAPDGSSVLRNGESGPTLAVYAGHSFPRPMTEVLKNPQYCAKPFSADMLTGYNFLIDVEPYGVYEAMAWKIARKQHLDHENQLFWSAAAGSAAGKGIAALRNVLSDQQPLTKEMFDNVTSRRIMMPVHVVTYSYLSYEFRAFINGRTGAVFGVHEGTPLLGSILSVVNNLPQHLPTLMQLLRRLYLPPQVIAALVSVLSTFLRSAVKFVLWPPFLVGTLLATLAFTGQQLLAPIARNKRSFAEWEETRMAEKSAQARMSDDWVFRATGESARQQAYQYEYEQSRAREQQQEQQQQSEYRGARAESSSWEERAERGRAWRQQAAAADAARQKAAADAAAAARARAAKQQAKPKGKPLPPLSDAGDYYEVLGITGGPSSTNPAIDTKAIAAAFNREVMKYHPDHALASGFDPAECAERTKAITNAYSTLRNADKRRAYDSSYRPKRR